MEPITATDPLSHSADLTTDNIERLRELFPEAVTEDGGGKRIDFDVLRELLGGELATGEEKYGLNWHGKRAARRLALTPSTGTLRPAPEDSVDWDTTQNLMIEGDNLEVLKLLQKSYAGKVKMIYIDPPYNTGNDFVYMDDFKNSIDNYQRITGQRDDEGAKLTTNSQNSGRFHTTWLDMIYPRLQVAKVLLQRDGVIFISIDDNEIQNLTAVCNEVFGEENHIATLVWERGRKNDARRFSVGHEYILCFARDLTEVEELLPAWREPKEGVSEIVAEYLRLKNLYGSDYPKISAGLVSFYSLLPDGHPAKRYARSRFVDKRGIWRDNNISWPGGGGPKYELIHPRTGLPCKVPEDGWRFIEPTMKAKIRDGYVEFREDHTKSPFLKSYLFIDGEQNSSDEDEAGDKQQVMASVFYRHSQPANDVLKALFGEKIFENPKDHVLIRRLVRYCTGPTDVVMDFFAGTGTTAHAVAEQNVKDGGARKFILCQLPEHLTQSGQGIAARFCDSIGKPRILSELTKERLRRVSNGIKSEHPLFHGDLGFRVFKLNTTSIRPWDPTLPVTEQRLLGEVDNILPGRTEQDLLYELLLKRGLELTVPIVERVIAGKRVYAVTTGDLIACLAPQIESADVEALAEGIVAWHKELAPPPAVDPNAPLEKPAKFDPPLVVFRDTAFADDVAKSNLTEILKQHRLTDVRSL